MKGQDKLADRPFDYVEAKNGIVQITYRGKVVTTLKSTKAAKFSDKVSRCNESERQLLMAKATGQFKHGNER